MQREAGMVGLVRGMNLAARHITAGMTGAEARAAIKQAADEYQRALPAHLQEAATHG